MIDEEMIMKKCKVFLEKNINIHIDRKNNKGFYNGYVREIKADFIMFEDSKFGLLPVFYSEMFEPEPFITPKIIGEKRGENSG